MEFPASSEVELIAAAQMGDGTATAQLIDKYMPAIRGAARQYATVDRDDAEQEALCTFLECLREFDPARGKEFRQLFANRIGAAVAALAANAEPFTVEPREYRRFLAMLRDADGDVNRAYALANGGRHGMSRSKFVAIYNAVRGTASLDQLTEGAVIDGTRDVIAHPIEAADRTVMTTQAEIADAHFALGALDERGRKVCRLAYGFDTDHAMSDAEVAVNMPIPTERGKAWNQRSVNRKRLESIDVMRTVLSDVS